MDLVDGFSNFKLLTGPHDSSFGSSLTSLGDADIDNYGDFCVGAPHVNHKSGNSGSIFMFNGQRAWSNVPSLGSIMNRLDVIIFSSYMNFSV